MFCDEAHNTYDPIFAFRMQNYGFKQDGTVHMDPAARHEGVTDELGVYQRWLANHELHEAEEWQEKEVRKFPRFRNVD